MSKNKVTTKKSNKIKYKGVSLYFWQFLPLLIYVLFLLTAILVAVNVTQFKDKLVEKEESVFTSNSQNFAHNFNDKISQWTANVNTLNVVTNAISLKINTREQSVQPLLASTIYPDSRAAQESRLTKAEADEIMLEVSDRIVDVINSNRCTSVLLMLNHRESGMDDEIIKKLADEHFDENGKYVDSDYSDIDENVQLNALFVQNSDPINAEGKYVTYIASDELQNKLSSSFGAASIPERWESMPLKASNIFMPSALAAIKYKSDNPTAQLNSAAQFGRWVVADKLITDEESWFYTVPVIYNNFVYGVVGIGVTFDYMEGILSGYNNQTTDLKANYVFAHKYSDTEYHSLIHYNNNDLFMDERVFNIKEYNNNDSIIQFTINQKYIAHITETTALSDNTFWQGDNIYLMSVCNTDMLYSFSTNIEKSFIIIFVSFLAIGILVSAAVAFWASRKIIGLDKEIDELFKGKRKAISHIGIKEVDSLVHSIEAMNNDMVTNNARLNNVLHFSESGICAFYKDDINKGCSIFAGASAEITGDSTLVGSVKNSKVDEYFRSLSLVSKDEGSEKDNAGVYTFLRIDAERGRHWLKLCFKYTADNYYGTIEDVSATYRTKMMIEYERDHDALTGLYNRRAFVIQMSQLILDESFNCAALFSMDIDNLKTINDLKGQVSGDNAIRNAAQQIKLLATDNMLAARVSGDEFSVLLYGYDTGERALAAAKDFIEQLQKAVQVPMSGGYAIYPDDASGVQQLMDSSMNAMDSAKKQGKNRFLRSEGEQCELQKMRSMRLDAFNDLIANNSVDYYFQPIVSLSSGRIYAYEALMRPRSKILSNPLDVLTVAKEEYRLHEVEVLTWRNAARRYIEFEKEFQGKYLFINSIPNELLTEEELESIVGDASTCFDRIVVEYTENEQLAESVYFKKSQVIQNLRCRVALDDYGSGYSNESMLLMIAPHYVKIDRQIVTNIDKDENRKRMVTSIVNYCKPLDIRVIAEGIETMEEMITLREIGVTFGQGFYFACPSPRPSTISTEAKQAISNLTRTVYSPNTLERPKVKPKNK